MQPGTAGTRHARRTARALLLLTLLPAAAAAQSAPAVTLPSAAPTGAAELALLVHWIRDTPPLFGFAFGSEQRVRPLHVQLAYGRERGVTARWVLAVTADHGWRVAQAAGRQAHGFMGVHGLFDRRSDELLLRVPLGVRAEAALATAGLEIAPVFAAGVAGGVTPTDAWLGYGGGFAEAGLRLALYGAWAQAGALVENQWAGRGADLSPPRARYILRFGYVPPPAN